MSDYPQQAAMMRRYGHIPVSVDATVKTMPMKVVALEAFRAVAATIDAACDDVEQAPRSRA